MRYLLPAHLGSASTILDASGSVVSTAKYWPYGAVRSGAIAETDKLFEGARRDPASHFLPVSGAPPDARRLERLPKAKLIATSSHLRHLIACDRAARPLWGWRADHLLVQAEPLWRG